MQRHYFTDNIQFSSVPQSCPTLCDSMNCSMPGLPVHHQLPAFTQTHVHWVSDAIQPFHPLSSPASPALNLSQHQSLFKWVSSSHQMAKALEFQLQHQSFQWINKTAGRNINNLRYADDTTLMAESEEELKASWWKWKWRVKKLV